MLTQTLPETIEIKHLLIENLIPPILQYKRIELSGSATQLFVAFCNHKKIIRSFLFHT